VGESKINLAKKRCFHIGTVKLLKLALCIITKPSDQFAVLSPEEEIWVSIGYKARCDP
jgi:hypothetical protein